MINICHEMLLGFTGLHVSIRVLCTAGVLSFVLLFVSMVRALIWGLVRFSRRSWYPKIGQNFWTYKEASDTEAISVVAYRWIGSKSDIHCFTNGVVFKSKLEAQREANRIIRERIARALSEKGGK